MSDETPELEPPLKKQRCNEEFDSNDVKEETAAGHMQTECAGHMQSETMDFSKDVDLTESNKEFGMNDKYTDYVTPEELDRLREFKVLDETKSNDEDSNDDDSDSSEGVPDDEIEKMLDENLPEELKAAPKPKEKPYVTRQKIVLEEKGVNQIEVLPLDWMMARHYSGMPVYVHRTTRVCTLSKPYFLAKGNIRRHDIPISAIPCLAYRRALEEEEKQLEIDRQIQEQIKNGTWRQYSDINENAEAENPLKAKFPFLNGKVIKNTNTIEIGKRKCPFSKVNKDESTKDDAENDKETKINENSNDSNNDNKETDVISEVEGEVINEINDKCTSDEDNENDKKDTKQTEQNKIFEDTGNTVKSESKENSISKISAIELSDTNVNEMKSENKDIEHNDTKNIEIEINITDNKDHKINDTEPNRAKDIQEKGIDSEEKENTETSEKRELPPHIKPVVLPGGIVMPPPRVENVATSWKTQHLTHEQVNEYCRKLFKFKTINIMHFRRWADRRKYTKARKTLQYPTLPEGTKLITIPIQSNGENGGKPHKRDWVMNMDGRSYLSVFHEYVCRVLQKQPVYEFKQLENASTPYQATVLIGGMAYGVGVGSSKRAAKSAAARASIHVLIPEMRELDQPPNTDPHCTFFDYVGIEDPRVPEFCAAACEPSPYAVLRTCLLRNIGAGDRHIHTQMKKLELQEIELTMRVGKHCATVVCKNKKTAKQRASQVILQALHPQVRSWGSLLRLYGSRSLKSCKEKKMEEQQITLLQDSAKHNEPNYAVLEKLRNEMRKLRERDEAIVPIGTLLVTDDLPTHSGSNLNNVDL